MSAIATERVEYAVTQIAAEVQLRLDRSPKMELDERSLWLEFTCCVLSSQVPYELARGAAAMMDRSQLLFTRRSRSKTDLQAELYKLLSTPVACNGHRRRYQFPRAKSAQIAQAHQVIMESHGTFAGVLQSYTSENACREWLVGNVPGLGPKQASMFLRNAAGVLDLAILDRHVLRYMTLARLGSGSESLYLSNITSYVKQEEQLRAYASRLGFRVGILDWAIWIVMRAASTID